MQALINSTWIRVPALFAVVAILSGMLIARAAMAQEETAVENHPTVLKRDITLWSDGTRLSGVLLYPKDREEALRRLWRRHSRRGDEARDCVVRQVPEG